MKTEFREDRSVLLGLLAFGLLACLPATAAVAQNGRTYERNGIRYQEQHSTVSRPIATVKTQERSQLVHRLQVTSETRDSVRNYVTPVTQHQWVTQMHGRWNPFVQPYYSQKLVPVTRWESRTEVVQVPVTRQQWVPEVRTVQVQVPGWRMAEEKVVREVALGPATGSTGTAVANRTPVGGPASLSNDPPKWGTRGLVNGSGRTSIRK